MSQPRFVDVDVDVVVDVDVDVDVDVVVDRDSPFASVNAELNQFLQDLDAFDSLVCCAT
jgi:hypothetical protein